VFPVRYELNFYIRRNSVFKGLMCQFSYKFCPHENESCVSTGDCGGWCHGAVLEAGGAGRFGAGGDVTG
jgi:hypothetical protein